MSVNRCRR